MTWQIYLKSRLKPPQRVYPQIFSPLLCPFLSLLRRSHTISQQAHSKEHLSLSLPKFPAMKGGKSSTRGRTADSKLSVKKKAGKQGKDPNKPKRPPSAFFVFMEDFRKQYKEKNPNNKSVAAVGKAGGEKWKSLSVAEKGPYVEKAEKRKKEYEKNMQAYNKKQSEGAGDDDSDKSRSEVNDEDGSGEDDEDDDE